MEEPFAFDLDSRTALRCMVSPPLCPKSTLCMRCTLPLSLAGQAPFLPLRFSHIRTLLLYLYRRFVLFYFIFLSSILRSVWLDALCISFTLLLTWYRPFFFSFFLSFFKFAAPTLFTQQDSAHTLLFYVPFAHLPRYSRLSTPNSQLPTVTLSTLTFSQPRKSQGNLARAAALLPF